MHYLNDAYKTKNTAFIQISESWRGGHSNSSVVHMRDQKKGLFFEAKHDSANRNKGSNCACF